MLVLTSKSTFTDNHQQSQTFTTFNQHWFNKNVQLDCSTLQRLEHTEYECVETQQMNNSNDHPHGLSTSVQPTNHLNGNIHQRQQWHHINIYIVIIIETTSIIQALIKHLLDHPRKYHTSLMWRQMQKWKRVNYPCTKRSKWKIWALNWIE